MGIEVVIGDFADYTSLLAALNGIEAAYFCYPVGAGLTALTGSPRLRSSAATWRPVPPMRPVAPVTRTGRVAAVTKYILTDCEERRRVAVRGGQCGWS